MKRSRKRKNHILILFIVIVVSFLYQNDFSLKNIEKKTISVLSMNDTEESVSKETFTKAAVIRVVDGDTLVAYVDGTEQKIRLIGIDTPESVHPDASKNTQEGIDASNYTKSSTVRNRDTERSFIIDTIQFYEKASEIFPKDDDEWEEVIRLSSEINQKYKELNPDKDHPEYFNSYITTTLIVLLDVIQKQVKGGH